MHPLATEGAGHDLHRLAMTAIASDICNVAAPVHHHPMPLEEPFVGDGLKGMTVEISHHLCDAGFRWSAAESGRRHSKLPTQRGLHAVTIEDFPLDCGCAQCIGAQEFDHEIRAIILAEMTHGANRNRRILNECLLLRSQTLRIPFELRPALKFPIPCHGR
jgi:hypothetical protein